MKFFNSGKSSSCNLYAHRIRLGNGSFGLYFRKVCPFCWLFINVGKSETGSDFTLNFSLKNSSSEAHPAFLSRSGRTRAICRLANPEPVPPPNAKDSGLAQKRIHGQLCAFTDHSHLPTISIHVFEMPRFHCDHPSSIHMPRLKWDLER